MPSVPTSGEMTVSNESRRKRLTHEALNDFGGGMPAAERVYGSLATLSCKLVAAGLKWLSAGWMWRRQSR